MSELVTINLMRGGLVMKTARKIKNIANSKRNYQSTLPYYHDINNLGNPTALHNVELSNFRAATEEIKAVFSGVHQFPYIDVYVHGSWADNTKTAFSDLDDFIIIDRQKIGDSDQIELLEFWLNSVDMKFCRIDPLQHHGHWFVYKDQLDNYDESYIPLTVLDGAISVQRSTIVRAMINEELTLAGMKQNLQLTIENIQYLYNKYNSNLINLYEMKALIGSFLLVPAYSLQIRGERVSKKWAIENSQQVYSDHGNRVLALCSLMRKEWDRVLASKSYSVFSKLPYLFTNPHVYRRFAKRAAPIFMKQTFPELQEVWVNKFITDTLEYVNEC